MQNKVGGASAQLRIPADHEHRLVSLTACRNITIKRNMEIRPTLKPGPELKLMVLVCEVLKFCHDAYRKNSSVASWFNTILGNKQKAGWLITHGRRVSLEQRMAFQTQG